MWLAIPRRRLRPPSSGGARLVAMLALVAGLALGACTRSAPAGRDATARDVPGREPGQPIAGLTPAQLAEFQAGKALFDKVFSPGEGLGPLFNENQCSACHTHPASGGTGEQHLRRGTRFLPSGRCDTLTAEGGENVRSRSTPLLAARGIHGETMPADATERTRFSVPFLFGLGLAEAVPDSELLALADSADADHDGVSGRVGRGADGVIGRFGRKADVPTLESFISGAAHFEMGLTSPLRMDEGTVNGRPFAPGTDPAPEPELSRKQLDLLVAYVRFLAPIDRGRPRDDADARRIARGERIFGDIGCAVCHRPMLETGANSAAALDHRRVHLYSDLLLHDLGPGLKNVCGRNSTPFETRTEPLMGLRYRRALLHDGRALGVEDAINAHAGEAAAARARFQALSLADKLALLRFLDTL